jgi:hypothetical protein
MYPARGGEKSHTIDCVMARSYIPSKVSELVSIWHFEEAGGKLEIIIFSRFEGRKSWRSRISRQPIIMFIFDGIILAFYHIF